jgi:hypothetical protein
MVNHGRESIPEPIAQLQRQLEQFRSAHPRRTKLPEPLWQAAVDPARQYGLYPVAHPDFAGAVIGPPTSLGLARPDHRTRQAIQQLPTEPLHQTGSWIPLNETVFRQLLVSFRQACVSQRDSGSERRRLSGTSPHGRRFHSDEEFVPFDVIACSSGPSAGKGLIEQFEVRMSRSCESSTCTERPCHPGDGSTKMICSGSSICEVLRLALSASSRSSAQFVSRFRFLAYVEPRRLAVRNNTTHEYRNTTRIQASIPGIYSSWLGESVEYR